MSTPELDQISIHSWIISNQIKNEKGDPIEFSKHKYLFHIYSDTSPNLVVMKAAQVGMSTCEIIKNIYDIRKQKMDCIYTLPTQDDVNEFVGGKVNRIIQQNPVLQEWIKDKDTIEQKKVGESMIYYRGTWTAKQAIMITADRLVHDEIDSSKQDIVKDYQSRLQHSKYKEIHVFSHPSSPGVGVDVYWKLSDQKHWFIICPHCKQEQFMNWSESFDLDRKIYVCKYCKGELSDKDRCQGRWVKKFKEAKFSGYWIPSFISPMMSAAEIIDKYNDPKVTEEFFYNKVLGLPYAGSGNIVSQDVIFQNLTNKINEQKGRIIIGVDTGIDIRYVIGNEDGIFYYGQCKSYEEVERYLKKWERSIMVIDQGGDIIGPRRLREMYPGRVFLCFYQKDKSNKELISWGKDKEIGKVRADRNRMIQLVVDEFTDRRIPLFGTENDWYEYWLHWSHIYRVKEENNIGVMEYKWLRSDRDDWCFVAGTMIETINGEVPIEKVSVGDYVLTREGYKRVLKSGITKKYAKIMDIELSNGKTLEATPNHSIWVLGKGWTRLDRTSYGDIMKTSNHYINLWQNQKKSFLKGLNLGDTLKQGRGHINAITLQRQTIVKKVLEHCIKKYGKKLMEIYQKGLPYIIEMKTPLTMKLRILNVSREEVINHSTIKGGLVSKKTLKSKKSIYRRLDSCHTNGEKQKKVSNGTANTPINQLDYKNLKNLIVLNAEKNPKLIAEMGENFVQEGVVIVGMHGNTERKHVYNLSVEDCPEYFANGVLAHNCHATIYWRIGIGRFGQTGSIISPSQEIKPNSYTISPNMTIPAPKPEDIWDMSSHEDEEWR